MPGLARKLIICAAVDGLVIQPLSPKGQRPSPPVKVRFGDGSISTISRDLVPDVSSTSSSFEAFGIVGLITVSRWSYLITITRRQQVAHIRGYPVYVVTDVALTPCSSHQAASESISRTAAHLNQLAAEQPMDESGNSSDSRSDDGEVQTPAVGVDEISDEGPNESVCPGVPTADRNKRSSFAEDVISKRGSYGRFAQRWFSKSGWMLDNKRSLGLSDAAAEARKKPAAESTEASSSGASSPRKTEMRIDLSEDLKGGAGALLPKLLKTTHILFGTSRSFYFSYDVDITRSFLNQAPESQLDLPLHRRVEDMFFWNRNCLKPLVNAGADALALPLMQGFIGQRQFVVDQSPPQVDDSGAKDSMELGSLVRTSYDGAGTASPPAEKATKKLRPSEREFMATVISRRSIKRAGLRYLRRGVNEDGYTANAVETEQILSSPSWDSATNIYSFLQIRGSIPLFFTQSPYSLKPVPVLQHSEETNYQALKKHFTRLQEGYGALQVVNLVEKHGIEATIGAKYQDNVKRFNEEEKQDGNTVPFEWFDFHDACRGMKFENVSLVLDILGPEVTRYGSSVETAGGMARKQQGVLRTNCMDCLDRTNVCQSSFAKYMLDLQLQEEGFDMAVQTDQINTWFNTLWADNGDAISKQYASTDAMKGDYTRTKKRDYRGALTDVGLSLTRFYNGMVNDYFSQAAIDFLIGNVTSLVFDEFEADMMTKDPAVSMQKMREQAIELCQKRVVADDKEEFIGGWVMLTPRTQDSIKDMQLEEAVLLLTDAAAYVCRFDWKLDKVSSFERVELAHVTKLQFGTYITSILTPAQMDEMRNVGLVISYQPGKDDIMRVNTRSLSSLSQRMTSERNSADSTVAALGEKQPAGGLAGFFAPRSTAPQAPPTRRIALKALYAQSSLAVAEGVGAERPSEIQQVVTICADIERLAMQVQPIPAGTEHKSMIENDDIISLAEAKRSAGLLEQLGHSIKKMVWAS